MVLGSGEAGRFCRQFLFDGFESNRDERLDAGRGRVDLVRGGDSRQCRGRHVFQLALVRDSDYSFHEAAPFCVGLSVSGPNRSTIRESLRVFNYGTPSRLVPDQRLPVPATAARCTVLRDRFERPTVRERGVRDMGGRYAMSTKNGIDYPSTSIIVTAYNIEDCLARCLDSILAQSETDFEVIVVDDGSTDMTLEIASTFAKKDPRITVLTQKNTGPAQARQNGFLQSKGEFILFVDGDDFLMPTAIHELLTSAKKSGADILCFNHKELGHDGITREWHSYGHNGASGSFLERLLLGDIAPALWTKFIRKDFIISNKVSFPPALSYAEDAALMISIATHNPRVEFLDAFLYCCCFRATSITREVSDKIFDVSAAIDFIQSTLTSAGLFQKYQDQFLFLYFYHNFYYRLSLLSGNNSAMARKLYDKTKNALPLFAQNRYIKQHIDGLSKLERLQIYAFSTSFFFGRTLSSLIRTKETVIRTFAHTCDFGINKHR